MSECYLDKAREFISTTNPKLEQHFVGCSEEEILALESQLGCTLPQAFREFLAWFGKEGGKIMVGTDFYYDCIKGKALKGEVDLESPLYTMNHFGVELLDGCELDGQDILKNALVFMMHQGYIIDFIKLDEGDNPPVYGFSESSETPEVKKLSDSFSEYIESLLKEQGTPAESLLVLRPEDIDNPYGYDDKIKHLSFNGTIKSDDGKPFDRIYDFVNLEYLDLRYFNLTFLPDKMAVFEKLKTLNLNGNHLTSFPASLLELQNLEEVFLSGNQISKIPLELGRLKKLKHLNISGNRLSGSEIEKLTSLLPPCIELLNRGQRTDK